MGLDWTVANAERIVRGTPAMLGPLVIAMDRDSSQAAIHFGEYVARFNIMPREKFIATVRYCVEGVTTQDRILAALE